VVFVEGQNQMSLVQIAIFVIVGSMAIVYVLPRNLPQVIGIVMNVR
jgi:uncharacterized membrane protein YedE/YeeE